MELNYEAMFGKVNEKDITKIDKVFPDMLPLVINHKRIADVMEEARKKKSWALIFVIGTKPCFYKFYGSIKAAEKYGIPHFLINSNQHYDDILTYGLKEFDLKESIGANLSLRGDLVQKSAEMFLKIGWIARYLKKKHPDVTVVPVVLGDTIMTSIVPAAWMFSRYEKAIQIEAGLRSMAPSTMRKLNEKTDIKKFAEEQWNGKWELLRNEPFPEQWDTFVSAAGSEFLFTPLKINEEHLLREGYSKKNIWITGGVVADALEVKRKEKAKQSIFNIYPVLEEGEWIRVDIHRRGNLTPKRFKAIVSGVKELVKRGHNVAFIEMSATRNALDAYGLRSVFDNLSGQKNFLHTKVWPEYAQVLEFFRSEHSFAPLTDSGGVQEEMNLINKPTLTARFNTDRPETVMQSKTNILVPPLSGKFMADMVEMLKEDKEFLDRTRKSSPLYGKNVGDKIMKITKELIRERRKPYQWSHEALGVWEEKEEGLDYL